MSSWESGPGTLGCPSPRGRTDFRSPSAVTRSLASGLPLLMRAMWRSPVADALLGGLYDQRLQLVELLADRFTVALNVCQCRMVGLVRRAFGNLDESALPQTCGQGIRIVEELMSPFMLQAVYNVD